MLRRMKNFHKHMSSHHSFMYLWVVGAMLVLGGLIWSYMASHPAGIIDGQPEGDVRSTVAAFGNQLNAVSLLSPDAADQIRAAYGPYVSEELLASWIENPSTAPGRATSSPWPDHIEVERVTMNDTDAYDVSGRIILTASTGDAGSVPVFLTVANTEHGYRITAYAEGTNDPVPVVSEGRVTLALGETQTLSGVSITPVRVIEDSRCPMDAMCVWQGTARVEIMIEDRMGQSVMPIELSGEPVTSEIAAIWLESMEPYPMASQPTEDASYRFSFRVEAR